MKGGPTIKFISCCCLSTLIAIVVTMFCQYNSLWSVAKVYDAAAIDGSTYDGCGIDTTGQTDIMGNQATFESGWTQIFKFNAIVYAIFIGFSGVALVTLWVPLCSAFVLCCNTCLFLPLMVAVIMTGVRRLSAAGS